MAADLEKAWREYKEKNNLPQDLPIQQANPPFDEQHPLWGLQVLINGGQPTPEHFERAWRALHNVDGLPVPPLLPAHHPLRELYIRSQWRIQHPNGVMQAGRRHRNRQSRRRTRNRQSHRRSRRQSRRNRH